MDVFTTLLQNYTSILAFQMETQGISVLRLCRFWFFHIVVLQGTAMKCKSFQVHRWSHCQMPIRSFVLPYPQCHCCHRLLELPSVFLSVAFKLCYFFKISHLLTNMSSQFQHQREILVDRFKKHSWREILSYI